MSYLERLRKMSPKNAISGTDKTDKTHLVSLVSSDIEEKRTISTEAVAPNEVIPTADQAAPEEPREDAERIAEVVATLDADPARRLALKTHTDVDPDDVIVTLAIRGKGACEICIPKSRYDAFRLWEAVEKHTRRETLQ